MSKRDIQILLIAFAAAVMGGMLQYIMALYGIKPIGFDAYMATMITDGESLTAFLCGGK